MGGLVEDCGWSLEVGERGSGVGAVALAPRERSRQVAARLGQCPGMTPEALQESQRQLTQLLSEWPAGRGRPRPTALIR
jgi:hypothetical protein